MTATDHLTVSLDLPTDVTIEQVRDALRGLGATRILIYRPPLAPSLGADTQLPHR